MTEKTTKRVKSRYWDFVYNNETDETSERLKSVMEQWEYLDDAAFQHETAPSTGTRHLQGWVKLKDRQHKSYLLNSRLNMGEWEGKLSFRPARNPKALIEYCCKEGGTDYWRKVDEQNKLIADEAMNTWNRLYEEAMHMPEYNSEDEGY